MTRAEEWEMKKEAVALFLTGLNFHELQEVENMVKAHKTYQIKMAALKLAECEAKRVARELNVFDEIVKDLK